MTAVSLACPSADSELGSICNACMVSLYHIAPRRRSVPNVVCSCLCHAPCQLDAALDHANRAKALESELAVAKEELQQERDARALLEAQHSELEEQVSTHTYIL